MITLNSFYSTNVGSNQFKYFENAMHWSKHIHKWPIIIFLNNNLELSLNWFFYSFYKVENPTRYTKCHSVDNLINHFLTFYWRPKSTIPINTLAYGNERESERERESGREEEWERKKGERGKRKITKAGVSRRKKESPALKDKLVYKCHSVIQRQPKKPGENLFSSIFLRFT